jgi:hypothetical protein
MKPFWAAQPVAYAHLPPGGEIRIGKRLTSSRCNNALDRGHCQNRTNVHG